MRTSEAIYFSELTITGQQLVWRSPPKCTTQSFLDLGRAKKQIWSFLGVGTSKHFNFQNHAFFWRKGRWGLVLRADIWVTSGRHNAIHW